MGILGYTEQETLATTMPVLENALAARMKFTRNIIKAFLGGDDEPEGPSAARPLTTELFDAMFP